MTIDTVVFPQSVSKMGHSAVMVVTAPYTFVRVLRPSMSRCIRIGHIRVSGTAVSRTGGRTGGVNLIFIYLNQYYFMYLG